MKRTVTQDGNVTTLNIRYKKNLNQRILLTADRHWDNPKSNQDLQLQHLEDAVRDDAYIIDFGDLFCAMQGKWDKRKNKDALRVEHKVDNYFDALVDTATEFFEPYANFFLRISPGNHESSILNRHETDLTTRLVNALNQAKGSNIHRGGYSGWVIFNFDNGKEQNQVKLWYIHGYGGGGPVTKGVIQTNRQAVYIPDADIIVNGHTHDNWAFYIPRSRITQSGKQYQDEQLHLRLPTYKDEYGDGVGGWHVERGGPPKSMGAMWLDFTNKSGKFDVEAKRAK